MRGCCEPARYLILMMSSSSSKQITLFLSHASEDKADLVQPLAERLRSDFQVWYDKYELRLGDSLLAKISEGLGKCDFGVVILSKHFFGKKWPQAELDGLFALETTGRKVILPVWKDVTEEEVRAFSPILAGRLGVLASAGLDRIVHEIKLAVGYTKVGWDLAQPQWKSRFAALDEALVDRDLIEAHRNSREGFEQVTTLARQMISDARARTGELQGSLRKIQLTILERECGRDSFWVIGSRGLGTISLFLQFIQPSWNALLDCAFRVSVVRQNEETRKFETLEVVRLQPDFDRELNVVWKDSTHVFSVGDAVLDFAFERLIGVLAKTQNSDSP